MSTNTHTPEKAAAPAEPVIISTHTRTPDRLRRDLAAALYVIRTPDRLRRDLAAALYVIRTQDRDIAGLWRLCTACAAWGAAATLIAVFAVI